jgi:hypothetical protein
MADYLLIVIVFPRTLSTRRRALVIRDGFIVRAAELFECLSCAVTHPSSSIHLQYLALSICAHTPPQDLGNGLLWREGDGSAHPTRRHERSRTTPSASRFSRRQPPSRSPRAAADKARTSALAALGSPLRPRPDGNTRGRLYESLSRSERSSSRTLRPTYARAGRPRPWRRQSQPPVFSSLRRGGGECCCARSCS